MVYPLNENKSGEGPEENGEGDDAASNNTSGSG
jgi:hypothetical protein